MRLFAIGDIHGCATAFKRLVDCVDLKPTDQIVTLGDYFNKGSDSKGVLNHLIHLYRHGFLVPLLGNHELKLLQALKFKRTSQNNQTLVDSATLRSYSGSGFGRLADIPESHIKFVTECCQAWFETETHIFVHATVDPDEPMPHQHPHNLFWQKLELSNSKAHFSGKTVICGHTPQKNGIPLNLGHVIGLDTAACEGQWLTCLEVTSGQVWQANQQGDLRTAWIQNYHRIPAMA